MCAYSISLLSVILGHVWADKGTRHNKNDITTNPCSHWSLVSLHGYQFQSWSSCILLPMVLFSRPLKGHWIWEILLDGLVKTWFKLDQCRHIPECSSPWSETIQRNVARTNSWFFSTSCLTALLRILKSNVIFKGSAYSSRPTIDVILNKKEGLCFILFNLRCWIALGTILARRPSIK